MRLWVWDGMGAGLSGLCAVHCVLGAAVSGAMPLAGAAWSSPWVHGAAAAVVVPVAVVAFRRGYLRHGGLRGAVMGGLGVVLMLAGLASEWWGPGWGAEACAVGHGDCDHAGVAMWLNVAGAALLVSGHLLNGWDGFCACSGGGGARVAGGGPGGD